MELKKPEEEVLQNPIDLHPPDNYIKELKTLKVFSKKEVTRKWISEKKALSVKIQRKYEKKLSRREGIFFASVKGE